MKASSKVTRNYQITIPAEIREKLGIKEGDYVTFEVRGDEVIMKVMRKPWTVRKLGKKLSVEEIEAIANQAFTDDNSS